MKPETKDVVARQEGDTFEEVAFEESPSVVTSISTSGITTCSGSSSGGRRGRPPVGLTGTSSTSELLSTSSTSQKSSSMRELAKKLKGGNDRTTTPGAKQGRSDLREVPALDTASADSPNRDSPSRRTPHKEGRGARSSVDRQKRRGLELALSEELPSPPMLLEGRPRKRTDSMERRPRYTRVKLSHGDGTSPGAYRIDGSRQELLRSEEEISSDIYTVHPSATNNMGGTAGTTISNPTLAPGFAMEGMLAAELVAPAIDAIPVVHQGDSHSKDVSELVEQVNRGLQQNKILIASLIALLLVGTAIAVTVIIVIGAKDDRPTSAPSVMLVIATEPNDDRTTSAPSATVVIAAGPNNDRPTSTPTLRSVGLTTKDIQAAIQVQSPTTSFDDPDSPSSRALSWLEVEQSQDVMRDTELEKLLQRAALATLFFATEGARWETQTKWLSLNDECEWMGITCRDSAVVGIKLKTNNLEGEIPVETLLILKNSLEIFNLAYNQLIQTIPTEIGQLGQLTELRLFENELRGSIPSEIANNIELQHLALSSNHLTGTLPAMSDLKQLTFLDVRDNSLTGKVPDMSPLISLTHLHIFNTSLTGSISDDTCKTMEQAYINCGEVICTCCTGGGGTPCPDTTASEVPTSSPIIVQTSFPTMVQTSFPTMVQTSFPTMVPTSFPTMVPTSFPTATPTTTNFLTLRQMILATSTESDFSHSLSPASLALAWIEADAYSNNKFEEEGTARATSSLVQRFALVVLSYALNGPSSWQNDRGWLDDRSACISWNIQDLTCNSNGEITQINLHRVDGLSGTIPVELGLLTSLTKLDLARNDIEGTIPRSIGLLSKMKDLRLFQNDLVGTLPSEFRALAQMEHFAVTLNSLTGKIPDIGSMSQLTFLDLRDNRFTGEIPSGLAGLTSLQFLFLFNVDVRGTLPSALCSTLQVAWIDCGVLLCDCCTGRHDEACPL